MFSSQRTFQRLTGGVFLTIGLTVASAVLAADDKIIHGTACATNAALSSWTPGYDGFYALASLTAWCPLVKDNTVAEPTSVYVRVLEANYSGSNKITCTLYASGGTFTASSDPVTTSGNGIASLSINMGTIGESAVNEGYVVGCLIDNGDRLRSIKVTEP
jgi:hypothetical protein